MIRRLYVEKRPGMAHEAEALQRELVDSLGIAALKGLRLINRYDVEGLDEQAFQAAVHTVFSEPPVDQVSDALQLDQSEQAFAIEYLPGQFDQRADSAAQCIQMQTQGERPLVRTARIYALSGELSAQQLAAIKRYLTNPVEAREASFDLPKTLKEPASTPPMPAVLEGFTKLQPSEMGAFLESHELAMGADDLQVCIDYFVKEGRDPSETELKVLDTYWSDHCRHTTFLTRIQDIQCEDPVILETLQDYLKTREALQTEKPVTLMDVATIAARALKQQGKLPELDESEEINACTIKVKVSTDHGAEDWLLLFKNETHNHPTEIEPFGGAATCIGGAIRDPLSARAYVYAGMRVTGAADPTEPIHDTLAGKLPQRQICQGAAAGFASYGNQIGVPTGMVKEIYHPGFKAKRMECGAVLGAVKQGHVRRERPAPGDLVILVGGRTGRDGCGGASGSSMAHTTASVEVSAAQVQKGNAPEERKLQRLFLNPEVTRLIKRCNDFGAGGVSVAIGELADGLDINLDAVPVKYAGLNGTELAISESQERMALVVAAGDAARLMQLAADENLEAAVVAEVSAERRLRMRYRGQTIVDLSRDFLDENGARKDANLRIPQASYSPVQPVSSFSGALKELAADLNGCSQKGLIERFDNSIGAGTVLLPLGGQHRRSAPSAMVHRLPVPGGTSSASYMSYGYDPFISSQSPYHGGYLAVVEAVSRLIAAGAPYEMIYLSHQEYFPRLGNDPERWGLPMASLLGAYRAQMELNCAAIGGKDSMSGSFETLDVPPTLISFAVTMADQQRAVSTELKASGHKLCWLKPSLGADGLPTGESLRALYHQVAALVGQGKVHACISPAFGGAAHALTQMALGNEIGVAIDDGISLQELFQHSYGSFILEMEEMPANARLLGETTQAAAISWRGEALRLSELIAASEARLEGVYPTQPKDASSTAAVVTSHQQASKGIKVARPRVLIPAFPGTNCELDSARAFEKAGAVPEVFILRNLSGEMVGESIRELAALIRKSQILFLPGGFSGGDEPDGSGKFITAILRSQPVSEALQELLDVRQGLVGGICNGFQALVKTGLLPNGRIGQLTKDSPTLTHNQIGRHQARFVTVRVSSKLSPWFSRYELGERYTLPISNGEGRFLCSADQAKALADNGQIAAQYVDHQGQPSMDVRFNPSGSTWALEALCSPDGRVMGRMGHSERMLDGLYRNVPSSGEDPLFLGAVDYYA